MIQENEVYRTQFQFTQEQVAEFARVTGDNNPLHLDEAYAATTPFKRPIVHGFLSGSIFSKVFGTQFPGEGSVYLKQSMEFLRPMFVDTPYEAVFTIKEINREKHQAVVTTEILDLEKKKVVLRGEAMVMNQTQL